MWRLMILDASAALLHPRLADKTPDQPTSIESGGQISIYRLSYSYTVDVSHASVSETNDMIVITPSLKL